MARLNDLKIGDVVAFRDDTADLPLDIGTVHETGRGWFKAHWAVDSDADKKYSISNKLNHLKFVFRSRKNG